MENTNYSSWNTWQTLLVSSRFWKKLVSTAVGTCFLFAVPIVVHLCGFPIVARWGFWALVGFLGLDVVLRLPRFVRAIRHKNSRPYVGWCAVDWSAYCVATILGLLGASIVGIF